MILCPACGRRTAEYEKADDAAKAWNWINRLTLCERIVKLVKKIFNITDCTISQRNVNAEEHA